jgi:hypothetical protein
VVDQNVNSIILQYDIFISFLLDVSIAQRRGGQVDEQGAAAKNIVNTIDNSVFFSRST